MTCEAVVAGAAVAHVEEALARCRAEFRVQQNEITQQQLELLSQQDQVIRAEASAASSEEQLEAFRSQRLRERLDLLTERAAAASASTRSVDVVRKAEQTAARRESGLDLRVEMLSRQRAGLVEERDAANTRTSLLEHAFVEQRNEFEMLHDNMHGLSAECNAALGEAREAAVALARSEAEWREAAAAQSEEASALSLLTRARLSKAHRRASRAEFLREESQAEVRAVRAELSEAVERNLCCICQETPREVLLQPCLHFAFCQSCVERVDICPLCRENVQGISRVIFA
eukprot:TRINITY_DN2391_c0_g1_i2.p1 TRINITY_DN2391_c0_g1~~TRINITY_DN2391_c0_g1_i2.p1  ORF type:complete len:288 (+),score=66.83 TRINITY_DN2391_c0_g1_i2:661-1524(+)